MSTKKSFVWKYFTKLNKNEVSCNLCQLEGERKVLQSGQSTTPMRNHLQSKHGIIEQRESTDDGDTRNEPTQPQPSTSDASGSGAQKRAFVSGTQTQLSKYFKVQGSLGEYLAKWASKNNFTVKGIVSCTELATFLAARNLTMPKSEETVWKYIESFYDAAFANQSGVIKEKLAKGAKFSISLDEWTDINMRRFMIIFLHDKEKAFNLGLVAIPPGHATTDVLKDLVIERLKIVEVNVDPTKPIDLVASTTDGDSTVVKIAAEMGITSKKCVNHAFHLAGTDVVYKMVKRIPRPGKKVCWTIDADT